MTDPKNEVAKPSTLREALRILARPAPRGLPLAGGTYLSLHAIPDGLLVDLSGLGLDSLRVKGGRCEVGAMATLAAIGSSVRVPQALRASVRRETNRNLREMATLGGALAVRESGPLLACLLALGSELTLEPGKVVESLDTWLRPGATRRRSTKLITGASWDAKQSLAYADVARSPMDRPIACAVAAALVKSGRLRSVRVVLSGAGQPLALQPGVGRIVEGASLEDLIPRLTSAEALIRVKWVDDIRGTGAYRAAIAPVLVRRALTQLFEARG